MSSSKNTAHSSQSQIRPDPGVKETDRIQEQVPGLEETREDRVPVQETLRLPDRDLVPHTKPSLLKEMTPDPDSNNLD